MGTVMAAAKTVLKKALYIRTSGIILNSCRFLARYLGNGYFCRYSYFLPSFVKVAPKDAEAFGAAPAGGGLSALSALLRSLCPCPSAHAAAGAYL